MEGLGSISSTDARLLEQFNVLIEQLYRMTSQCLPARLQNTVQSIGSTMKIVREAEDGEAATQCGEEVLNSKQRLEEGEGYVVRDGVNFSLEELLEATESRGTGLSARHSYVQVLAELPNAEALRSSEKCIREWVLVDRSHVWDSGTRLVFVKCGFISEGCCLSSMEYDCAAKKRNSAD